MAVSRILFELQNLDLVLDEARDRVAAIEGSLSNRDELKRREESLETLRERLAELERRQRTLDLTSQSAREKIAEVEGKLYGGGVSSPRELQDLSRELVNVKQNLQELDEQALENLVNLEEVESQVSTGEASLAKEEDAWVENQQLMEVEWEELGVRVEGLEEQRNEMTKELGAGTLQVYEKARRTRGGRVVAAVERGLCRGCGMTLPTHAVQRARSGAEPVQCGSCGSILYAA